MATQEVVPFTRETPADAEDLPGTPRDCSPVELFPIYFGCIQHENELINHRTTWLLAVESVLMAAAGYLFLNYSESFLGFILGRPDTGPLHVVEFSVAWLAVAYFGLVATQAGERSNKAALKAQESLETSWRCAFGEHPDYGKLPGLRGGDDQEASQNGEKLATKLTQTLLYFWGVCLVGFLLALTYWAVTAGAG